MHSNAFDPEQPLPHSAEFLLDLCAWRCVRSAGCGGTPVRPRPGLNGFENPFRVMRIQRNFSDIFEQLWRLRWHWLLFAITFQAWRAFEFFGLVPNSRSQARRQSANAATIMTLPKGRGCLVQEIGRRLILRRRTEMKIDAPKASGLSQPGQVGQYAGLRSA